MSYDLVIRNGTIIDGSGLARYRADVATSGNRIARIGRVDERGTQEIDAEGHFVSPGFIDAHTHMDAQLFWDSLGSSSCWHGVTTVVMGNCGFTLAPSRPGEHGLVTDNLERAEEIPATSMNTGIDWSWESFPEYLDAIERQPKAINYAAQIGHSALRTFAMSDRAFSEKATDADLELMQETLREALRAGAIGFSTSVSDHHLTPSGNPVASRVATWDELTALVNVVGQEGRAIFQTAVETERTESAELEVAMEYYDRLRALAVSSRVPITYGLRREHLVAQLETFDRAAVEGGRIVGQSRSSHSSQVFSFKTRMPFDGLDEWKAIRREPLERQRIDLQDKDVRQRLIESVDIALKTGKPRLPSFESLQIPSADDAVVSVASKASERGCTPIEAIIDLALETEFEQTFGRIDTKAEEADLLLAMRHPRTVMTFSDTGAHVGRHSGADLQTILLSRWVRQREVFTWEEAVRMVTLVPALTWGIRDRGLLREGMIADINVFDPDTVGPGIPTVANDLPGGVPRIRQSGRGIASTIVSGTEALRNGAHTGAFPGVLVRR